MKNLEKEIENLNICFILGAMNVGGVQTFILNLSKEFIRNNHKISVITTQSKGVWWEKLAANNITGYLLDQKNFFNRATHSYKLHETLKGQNFDVIFYNHSRIGQLSIPLTKDYSVCIPIIHNDPAGIVELALMHKKYSHSIVTVSKKLYDIALKRAEKEKVVQINYPVKFSSHEEFSKSRESISSLLQLVYVGRITEEQKGVLILPKILKECIDHKIEVELNIIGDGPDLQKLKDLLIELKIETFTKFHGVLSPDETQNYLLKSHILLMPSHYEGLGIVAVEAQGNGCVPIATYLNEVTTESILDGTSGFLIHQKDPSEYLIRIKNLVEEKGLWQKMSQAGRENAIKNFSIKSSYEKYLELVKKQKSKTILSKNNSIKSYFTFITSLNWTDLIPNFLRKFR